MRYLTWFTAGFGGAMVLCAYVLGLFPMGAVCAFFLGSAFFLLQRQGKLSHIPALLALGAMVGFLWYWGFWGTVLKPAEGLHEEEKQMEITLLQVPEEKGKGSVSQGLLSLNGRACRVRVFFKNHRDLEPGDRVRGTFRFYAASQQERHLAGNLSGEGIFLTAFQQGDLAVTEEPGNPWWTWPGKLRHYGETIISWCFTEKAAPFARALFLGDSSRMDFETRWDLRISGIRHLVAVSGLHISVLLFAVGMLTFQKPWLTLLLGFPLMVLFGAMTGFSPSVVRAILMMGLLLTARLFERKYDSLTALSAAVLVMLLLNPLTVTSVSFQLSAASVLGIVRYYGPIKSWILRRFSRRSAVPDGVQQWFSGSLAVSCSSLVFVTPLTVLYFGSVSLIAPLTNLLTVFLMPLLFWGILLTLVTGWFSLGAAMVLGKLVSMGLSLVLLIAHACSRVPLAAVFTDSIWILLWILTVYFAGFGFLRKESSGDVGQFFGVALLGLSLSLLLSWLGPLTHNTVLTVFDVGQGQCILLQSRGRHFLVDCGGDYGEGVASQAAERLLSQGVSRLDGLILTHFDRDHVCGAEDLLTVIDADRIYLPPEDHLPPDPRIRTVQGETALSFGDSRLTVCGSESRADSNERGLCVLLDSREYDILITGDRSSSGEHLLLSCHQIPKVDCLIAGHHGAADSTSQELLAAVRPETVIISAGRKNRYGHPAEKTLLRLRKFGCQVLRTDLDGTITIRR